jgi:hypothetical protein
MRESGVLAYMANRRPAGIEGGRVLVAGRVNRASAGQRLVRALGYTVLEVLIGEETCFPLFLTVQIGVRPHGERIPL